MGTISPARALRDPIVFGPTIAGLHVIRPAMVPRGARAYGARVFDPLILLTPIRSVLSRRDDASTMLWEFFEASLRQWQDTLSEAGSGSFRLQYDDDSKAQILLDNTDLITFFYKDVAAWTMRAKKSHAVVVDQSEESGYFTEYSGLGHLSLIADAVVFPSRGAGVLPKQQDRPFNWTAPEYPDGGWGAPFQVATLGAARIAAAFLWSLGDPTAPQAQPGFWAPGFDPFGICPLLWDYGATIYRAKPLPAEAGGTCYFRQTVSILTTTSYDIYFTCAASGDLSIDGQHVLSTGSGASFLNTNRASVIMTAGEHTIAWSATAAPDALAIWGLGFNAGFAGWQLYQPAAFGSGAVFIAQSDSSAKFVPYAAQAPGMTPGQAMLIAIREAQARGKIGYLEPQFTELVDSNGNPWPQVANIGTKVGNDLLTFFQELAQTYIDLWMAPGTTKLYAWRLGERGSLRSAVLAPQENLTSLEQDKQAPTAGSLLVDSAQGWSVVGGGDVEALLGLGADTTADEVGRVAGAQLAQFSTTMEQLTAAAVPQTDREPYIDFAVGDTVEIDGVD